MAYGEKLQLIDMLAAMEMGNQNNARRQQQENEMRQMQMQRQWQKEDQLKKDLALSNATMVVPGGFASAALPRMGEQVLLRDTPGYITGTPPETVFKEKMATGRAAMGAMSGGGGGGGGAGPTATGNATVDAANAQSMQTNALNDKYDNPDYQGGYKVTSPAQLLAEQEMNQRAASDKYRTDKQSDTAMAITKMETDARKPKYRPNSLEELNDMMLDGDMSQDEYISETDRIESEAPMRAGAAGDAKTKALNQAAKDISSDPRFRALGSTPEGKKRQIAIMEKIEDIVKKTVGGGKSIVDVGWVLKNYGIIKEGSKNPLNK